MKLFTFILMSSMVLLGACKGEGNVQIFIKMQPIYMLLRYYDIIGLA